MVASRGPQAEAWAKRVLEPWRPLMQRLYGVRRRVATAAMGIVAGLLLAHVVFGANGMVIYRQKHAETLELGKKIGNVKGQNETLGRQNAELSSENSKAVEREAREHLRYAKPGEFVYVPAPPPPAAAEHPETRSAKK